MKPILILIHIFVCLALVFIVLIQKGKGADMGAAFGGSSQAVFGSSTATTLLHKVTTVVAIVFMLTSLGLSIFLGAGRSTSVMEDVKRTTTPATSQQTAPAANTDEAPNKK